MAKAVYGEYDAYETPRGLRFRYQNKLIAAANVPAEIKTYLEKSLAVTQVVESGFKRPSEEEIARLKAESLERLKGTPAELAAPLDSNAAAPLDSNGDVPLPRADEPVPVPPVTEQESYSEEPQNMINPEFLDSISIHTAPLSVIAEALYNRFGIYTVYMGTLPAGDEINPLTAEPFTKYHLGIAYQAAIRAQARGLLEIEPEQNRKAIDQGRAASENFRDAFVPQPTSFSAAREQNSFDYRTSVRGANETINGAQSHYDEKEDELIVEPTFGKQVIRPDW